MNSQDLKDLLQYNKIDHPAYLVQTGKMAEALEFFTDYLGWKEDLDRLVEGTWGSAHFLIPKGKVSSELRVQITEENEAKVGVRVLRGVHLGIKFIHAQTVAEAVVAWAHDMGYKRARCYRANSSRNDKWFLRIPELFTFQLEFINIV